MRLAICDDNELERRILHSLLKKYFSEASISCEFTLYDHGTTLYYDIMDGMEFDIIFLDLFMEDSFGLTIAKSLRELFYRGRIVFCTASADYALESYSVYASGYIVKPYRIIVRRRQGQGKANRIYLKEFTQKSDFRNSRSPGIGRK